MNLEFYGGSDDLFEFEHNGPTRTLAQEIECYDKGAAFLVTAHNEKTSLDDRLIVFGQYAPAPIDEGVWVIGISLAAEGDALPAWPYHYEAHPNGYSTKLVIEAPDNAVITPIGEDADNQE